MTRASVARLIARPTRSSRPHAPAHAPTMKCPSCNAVSVRGRWVPEKNARQNTIHLPGTFLPGTFLDEQLCPACRQRRDHAALGVVELHGEAWRRFSNQVFQAIGHIEAAAREKDDQKRILWARTSAGITRIYTSLPDLARYIGRELERIFRGRVLYRRSPDKQFLRVVWQSPQQDER